MIDKEQGTPTADKTAALRSGAIVILLYRLQTLSLSWRCLTAQSWVNREYRKGMSTHPCGGPVLRINRVKVISYLHHLGDGPSGSPGPSCTVRG